PRDLAMAHDSERSPHVPLDFERLAEPTMLTRSEDLFASLVKRRSVRAFSDEPIPLDVVRRAIHIAAQAPSGANKQPWTFALVTDPDIKCRIREAAEVEEREFYTRRASDEWLDDLHKFDTDWQKPYLEVAPALIVAFAQAQGGDGSKHYYVKESMGLACGFLIAALHQCGLATLTHTPSPMTFLRDILGRPKHEKPFLLLPVGYPADGCAVPDITRKPLEDVLVEYGPGAPSPCTR
ncbi:MAG: nitroreductase family protein, partial [Myxococcota bacterium]